jgi:hypothetical protein
VVGDDGHVDDEDEFPPVSPGIRISALNGTIIVNTDPQTRLTTLGLEDPEGVLVACRVLGGDDLQRLVDALGVASKQAEASGAPVVVDVSQVIGRD